jgi:hypothetical protein
VKEEADEGVGDPLPEEAGDEHQMVVVDPDLGGLMSRHYHKRDRRADLVSRLVLVGEGAGVSTVGLIVGIPGALFALLVDVVGQGKVVEERPEVALAIACAAASEISHEKRVGARAPS